MKKLFPAILALAFALTLAAPAFAQLYKWTDKDGKVRYGDVPPAGAKVTPLKPPPRGAAAPAPAPSKAPAAAGKKDEKPLTPEEAFQKRQKERQEADAKSEKERADADISRANCNSAQQNLRQLESGQRMSTMSDSGERGYMNDAQRAQETERARKAVSDWCK